MSDTHQFATDRRSVLKGAGAATLFSLIHTGLSGQALAAASGVSSKTYDQAMRWIQLAFTEDDPGRYDPKFWLDYCREIGAEGICLSAGGSTAFYPSKIPYHRRARDLGDSDIFGEMVAGCKALGMSVIGRVDPHTLSAAAVEAHPEWVMRTPDGKPRHHPESTDLYLSCLNSGFMSSFMTDVLTEVARAYPVDGIFGNRWGGWNSLCYCEACKTQFRAASGFDIPTALSNNYVMPPYGHAQEAAAHAYVLWFQEMRLTQLRLWNETVKAVRPELFFVGGPIVGLELDPNRLGALSPIQFIDHQMRKEAVPSWDNGRAAKQTRAYMQQKPIVGIFSPMWRWKDGAQSGAELESWMADGVAQGFRPWVNKFNAKPHDTRWMPVIRARYNWLEKHAEALRNTANLARIALIHSPETTAFYGRAKARERVADYQDGYYQALVESRIPFEMLDARELDAAHTAPFRVLVLPNIAVLSDAQCQQVREFVQRGGRIVATHETSLYDETGQRRANFGLADLFGCDFAGQVEEGLSNNYLTLRQPHGLLRGLEAATNIMGVTRHVQVKAAAESAHPLTWVPPYTDQPTERFFPPEATTDTPMAFCREVGAGRVVYLPMDIERTFWQYLAVDHLAILRNAVEWAADEPPLVTIDGSGVLDVSVWRQERSLTVHLANLTNAMMMRGPMREALPVGPFILTLTLPSGVRVGAVHLLESGQTVEAQQRDGRLRVTVPRVTVHEIVHIETV